MAYTVNIKYTAVTAEDNQLFAMPICAMFAPEGGYADSAAYEGSVYDTNVKGFGTAMTIEQFVSESIAHPGILAQFKLAVESDSHEVEFTVEDHKEACYYNEVGKALAANGFKVTVSGLTKAAAETHATTSVDGSTDPKTNDGQ